MVKKRNNEIWKFEDFHKMIDATDFFLVHIHFFSIFGCFLNLDVQYTAVAIIIITIRSFSRTVIIVFVVVR